MKTVIRALRKKLQMRFGYTHAGERMYREYLADKYPVNLATDIVFSSLS